VVTGSGDVQLIVRDVLGRETIISQSYYASSRLLRSGLHDYSYELGFLRRDYTRKNNDYGAMVVSGTHRYGFSDSLTGEAHVEATRNVQVGGLSGSILWPGVGLFSASTALSNGPNGEGGLAGFQFERRTSGLSLGATAEFTTKNYADVGRPSDRAPPAATIQAFVGVPVSFGSIGASYLLRDSRGEADAELLSGNVSVRLGSLGTLHLAGRKSFKGEKDIAVQTFLTVPIGERTSASASLQREAGQSSLTANLQKNLPAGDGLGYRASFATGAIDRINGRLSLQTGVGNYDAEVTWTEGRMGTRLVVGGGLAIVGGEVFASRKLTQSFAAVRVGKYKNVRIYADNQLVGKTNGAGVAIVPRLRPYDKNIVRIELADLPMDTSVTGAQQVVRPYNRSGVTIDFAAKRERGALVNVVLEDGTALPAGATIRLKSGTEEFVSAPGGDVYLSNLRTQNVASASWSGRSCEFSFGFPDGDDPQPRLGRFTCKTGKP
jgi:outer membrane usher protein